MFHLTKFKKKARPTLPVCNKKYETQIFFGPALNTKKLVATQNCVLVYGIHSGFDSLLVNQLKSKLHD